MPPRLVIGNKTYSSWSMRPWILMRALDIAFDETVLPLYEAETNATLRTLSPAAKVPILIDGAVTIWDSLAIIEYLAEGYPEVAVWPRDRAARAQARSLAAEMHSGFLPLRRAFPMNLGRAPKRTKLEPEARAAVAADIARIETAFAGTRERFGADGPFLFGAFSAADAMYAPIVARLHTYAAKVGTETLAYMEAVMALSAWKDWAAGAAAEGWRIERFEIA